MATGATIKFLDGENNSFHVHRSHDAYPGTVIPDIQSVIAITRGRWAEPECGLLVTAFLAYHFNIHERLPDYYIASDFTGDESFRFYVSWDAGFKQWTINDFRPTRGGAMDEEIRAHLVAHCAANGYGAGATDKDLAEFLFETDVVWEKETSRHRWWTSYFTVVEIDGMLIGFESAKTTGDQSPSDTGWEFDPKTVCRVEAKQVTTVVYEKI